MPRIRRTPELPPVNKPELVAALVEELRNNHETGQPIIDETVFPTTNLIRVTVIWDRWEPLADAERVACILQAYEQAESQEFRDRIAMTVGLTMPEAREYGLLPFHVFPAVRRGDPVTLDQCREAMLRLGASTLEDPQEPQLRFPTLQQAEACVRRLIEELPASEQVWLIEREVSGRSA
jgi:hypothetical protein